MIYKNKLFNDYTLNIFTDASITEMNNEVIGCAGYVAVLGDNVISSDVRIVRETTNNHSEIIAVSMGVEFAAIVGDNPNIRSINLFSDSKVCIFGLREWIHGWLINKRNNILYNSKGEQVANQDVFAYIMNLIVCRNIRINLYHQNGHIKNTKASLKKAYDTFIKSNHVRSEVDMNIISTISEYNNMVDNNTRVHLLNTVASESFQKEQLLHQYFHYRLFDTFDDAKYKKLINI